MGCCESSQEPRDVVYIARTQPHRLATVEEYRTVQITQYREPAIRPSKEDKPYYGKFKCHFCNRHWESRFCWPDKYQFCKKCKSKVYPYTQRDLVANDFDEEAVESKEHQMQLCQKCLEGGKLCIKSKNLPRNKRYNKHYLI